jgi:HSP20 family protein
MKMVERSRRGVNRIRRFNIHITLEMLKERLNRYTTVGSLPKVIWKMTEKKDEKSQRPEDDSTALAIPRTGLPSIFEEFMRPFDQLMAPFFASPSGSFLTEFGREPIIDFQDRGDHYLVTAEFPGLEKKDLEVRIDSNVLELKAERSTDRETRSTEGRSMQSSRSFFHRYMTLPEEVVSEKVTGTIKNGVLELKLPKSEPKVADKSRRVDLK